MWNAPRHYYVRVLESWIGEVDRRSCPAVTHMHDVIDHLMQRLDAVRTPKDRHEVLRQLCRAVSMRPWQHELVECEPEVWAPRSTALIVAMLAQYEDVTDVLIEELWQEPLPTWAHDLSDEEAWEPTLLDANAWAFGTPLDVAIANGETALVQRLVGSAATLNLREGRSNCHAAECAAKRGHVEVIERLFRVVSSEHSSDYMSITMGRVAASAAAHCHWNVVSLSLHHGATWHIYDDSDDDYDSDSDDRPFVENILYQAIRDGQGNVARKILEMDGEDHKAANHYRPLRVRGPVFSFRGAACNGQLDICKMLIDKNVEPIVFRRGPYAQVIARYVASVGSVKMYRFLKQLELWTPTNEICFLPIAADHGHIEFAKLALEKGCDTRPKQRCRRPAVKLERTRKIRYPDDIRYFALCRAIASGCIHIVRWLINEVVVDVTKLAFHPLLPMDIAIAADNADMIALLQDLGVAPASVETQKEPIQSKVKIVTLLETYREALCLQNDYKRKWYRSTPWDEW